MKLRLASKRRMVFTILGIAQNAWTKTDVTPIILLCKATYTTAKGGNMELHHEWTQSHIEHGALYQGFLTVIQFHTCRKCKVIVGLPLGFIKPPPEGCTGFVTQPKLPWKSPNKKENDREPQKKDYPSKKKSNR